LPAFRPFHRLLQILLVVRPGISSHDPGVEGGPRPQITIPLVYFDRGEILQGLSAGVLVGFVVGSIAFGLAAARFISQPEWLRE